MLRPFSFLTRMSARFGTLLAFAAIAVLAWLAYHPGLAGGFLFDDFVNLPALGAFGPVDNATTFWRYLTSGIADFTGRPLALASFLVDARDWPADPYPFKRTSLILHLLNGALLAALLLRLGRILRGQADIVSRTAAVLGASLWLLHPLFVSTTLYVVQREAMLPATFILLGLIGHARGREQAATGRRDGLALAAASIVGGTLAALLCKANGALLPLLAWIVDALVLAPRLSVDHPRTRSAFTWLGRLLLIAPGVAVCALLAGYAVHGFVEGTPAHRPWTLGERLLTESRVVTEYLGLLWLPRSYSHGLFNDGYMVSTGLLSPPTTLLCIALLLALAAAAWVLRRRAPAAAVATLFFFAGHLIESSVVALELYFEHRNYVPALLMFWPLGLWLAQGWQRAPVPPLRGLRRALCFGLPLLLAALAFQRAELWGNTAEQGLLWAARNPDSPRAQAWAAQIEMSRGRPELAAARLEAALARHPQELQLAANAADAQCALGGLRPVDRDRLAAALANDRRPGRLAHEWLAAKLDAVGHDEGACAGLDPAAIEQLLDALGRNPLVQDTPARQLDLLNLRGRLALLHGDADAALDLFDRAVAAAPEPASALRQAVSLASAGHPSLGVRHLDYFRHLPRPPQAQRNGMPALHAWLLERQSYWPREIARLRATLVAEAAAR